MSVRRALLLVALVLAGCASPPAPGTNVTTTSTPTTTPPPANGTVALSVVAEPVEIRPGGWTNLTLTLANGRDATIWTNPSIVCTGSWDVVFRGPDGKVVRVDDRDAMGCPSGGRLEDEVAPGASASVVVAWDGRLRPQLGETRDAPPGTYDVDASARWADANGTDNADGPRAFLATARTTIVVAG